MISISIIVPVYNVENYIGRCIESIQKQTLQDWELILVDDASTDGSLSIIKNYNKDDDRVKVVSCSENKGPMCAREQGCKIAQGEYITFCDGDDELSNDALKILYDAAKRENADIIVGQLLKINPEGEKEPFLDSVAKLNYGNNKEAFYKSVLRREIHQGVAGKMFHHDIIKGANLKIFEHCTMSEDAAVLFQYINCCNRVYVVPDFIYFYYQRPDSSTHTALSMAQIEGICKTTSLRLKLTNQYPNLLYDANRYFSGNLVDLMKYNAHGSVTDLLDEYGLRKYISTKLIVTHFGIKDMVKLFINRDILPHVYYLRCGVFSKIM